MLPSVTLEHAANRNLIDRVIEARAKPAVKRIRDRMEGFRKERGDLSISMDPTTGKIDFVQGFRAPLTGGPGEIARSSIAEISDTLGLAPGMSEMEEIDRFEWTGFEHVRYQQTLEGIPIFGSEALVAIQPNREVSMLAGDLEPDPTFAAEEEAVSEKEAIQVAMDDLGEGATLRGHVSSKVVLFPKAKGLARSYQLLIPAAEPLGDWQYFIDTGQGKIMDSSNVMRFFHWPGPYTAGRGNVYLENPDEIQATGMLRRLRWPYRRLNGQYANIENDDGPEAIGSFPGFRFFYKPDDTHFDEVNCYHAVDRVSRYLEGLGFRGLTVNNPYGRAANPQGQIRAHVHTGTNYDNAFYSPSTGEIYFGDGSNAAGDPAGFRDLAKESDIIFHEFGHGVLDEIRPNIIGTDGAALHEAYADYFACSLTDEPELGEWVLPGPGSIRNLNNNKTYPNAPTQPHTRGLVWGGACWDLRQAVGTEVADYLIFGSMIWMTTTTPTFKYAKDRLLRVSQVYCGGDYYKVIRNIFEVQRGIPA